MDYAGGSQERKRMVTDQGEFEEERWRVGKPTHGARPHTPCGPHHWA